MRNHCNEKNCIADYPRSGEVEAMGVFTHLFKKKHVFYGMKLLQSRHFFNSQPWKPYWRIWAGPKISIEVMGIRERC